MRYKILLKPIPNISKKTLLSKSINQTQIDKTISILKDANAFEYATQKAQSFIIKAKKCLADLEYSPYKEALIRIADLSLNRKS